MLTPTPRGLVKPGMSDSGAPQTSSPKTQPTSTFDNSDLCLCTYLVSCLDPPFISRSSNVHRRNQSAHAFVPVDLVTPDVHAVWTSPSSGMAYPQKWKLGIESRGMFEFQSVVGDQEFAGQEWDGMTYNGFVAFTGV